MKIKRFIGGTLESNGYIIYQNKGGSCYIIDPGYQPKRFLSFINENELNIKGILLTHLHSDHTGAADRIRDALECPVYMHEADACRYRGRVDIMLRDGDGLDLDGEAIKILHTPGHTEGSICILCEKSRICFTGDTVFDTDLGRTDLAGGSEKEMEKSIKEVINSLSNDIMIYPGHEEGCTMKKVRMNNREFIILRDRT